MYTDGTHDPYCNFSMVNGRVTSPCSCFRIREIRADERRKIYREHKKNEGKPGTDVLLGVVLAYDVLTPEIRSELAEEILKRLVDDIADSTPDMRPILRNELQHIQRIIKSLTNLTDGRNNYDDVQQES